MAHRGVLIYQEPFIEHGPTSPILILFLLKHLETRWKNCPEVILGKLSDWPENLHLVEQVRKVNILSF